MGVDLDIVHHLGDGVLLRLERSQLGWQGMHAYVVVGLNVSWPERFVRPRPS